MKHAPDCKIVVGDCLDSLRAMPSNSVHCVVTSPPYYGLRDYGIRSTNWPEMEFSPMAGLPPVKIKRQTCSLGLESDPWSFIAHTVLVFREVRRVLRADGTCWVNMGDSYNGTGDRAPNIREDGGMSFRGCGKGMRVQWLKSKDLMMMPARIAMALQADGWWLRQDIIWNKPNPMPESVHDRCCKSHEYLFLLTPSARYYYDAEAIKEPSSPNSNPRYARGRSDNHKWADGGPGNQTIAKSFAQMARKNGVNPKASSNAEGSKQNASFSAAVNELVSTRHKRSVWTITTESCKEAHFATFPTALVRPCILAGTSAGGCCPDCAAPYRRVIEDGDADLDHQRACGGNNAGEYHGKATKDYKAGLAEDPSEVKARILAGMKERRTIGWEATCRCFHGPGFTLNTVPCTVLDIFLGSGTTARVAMEEGRDAIGLEINPEYAEIARRRTTNFTPSLHLPL
jgi:DNA modification methylase